MLRLNAGGSVLARSMRSAIAALPLTGLVACVSTQTAILNPTVRYAATCAQGVEIYTAASRAPSDAKEVAILTSKGSTAFTTTAEMLESVRKRAAEVGATGAVVALTEASAGAEVLAAATLGATARQGQTVALFAPSDTARVRQVCDSVRAVVNLPVGAGITLSRQQIDSLRERRGYRVTLRNAPSGYTGEWLDRSTLYEVFADSVFLELGARNRRSFPVAAVQSFGVTGRRQIEIALKPPR